MDPGEGNGEKRALDGEDLVSNKKLRKNRFHVRVLQDAFYGAQHPSAAKKAELADQTGLTLEQMQVWFAIRRAYDSCRPWQRKPSDENSIDDPMEGENGQGSVLRRTMCRRINLTVDNRVGEIGGRSPMGLQIREERERAAHTMDKYSFSCPIRRRVGLELRAGGSHMHAALQGISVHGGWCLPIFFERERRQRQEHFALQFPLKQTDKELGYELDMRS